MASPTSNPRLPFKAAFFDLDGTLLDTETLHMQAERRALSMLGVDRLVGDHPRTFGAGIEPGMRMLAETYELGDAQNLLDAYMPLWTHLVATELRSMPGARAAVDELASRQVPMALVTSSDREYVARTAGKLGLLKAFRCVITGDMVDRLKPSPEPYLTAAERLGVDVRSCVTFEDSGSGVQAAVAAGVHTVAVHSEVLSRLELSVAHDRLSSFACMTQGDFDRLFGPRPL